MDQVLETARTLCQNAPLSVRQAKKSIHHGLQMDLKRGLMFEIEAYNRLVDTEDRREGGLAFNEKRKPGFKGKWSEGGVGSAPRHAAEHIARPASGVRWQSGDASDCKSADAGSIPARTSSFHDRMDDKRDC